MKLLTKADKAALPPFYGTNQDEDPAVHVKLFTPDSSFTWYVLEYDELDDMIFAYVDGGNPIFAECGYVSLEELRTVTGPYGLHVERDIHWTPKPLSAVKASVAGETPRREAS